VKEERKPMRIYDPHTPILRRVAAGLMLSAMIAPRLLCAQEPQQPQELAARLDRMQRQLDATQRQLEDYRDALKNMQLQVQAMAPNGAQSCTAAAESAAAPLRQAVAELHEEQSVQQAEIAVHEQAKVETRSRYNLKIGGLALFNAFENDGAVDSIDVPVIAVPPTPGASHGSAGASMRQSLVTLDATGPQFWRAHTYANLQMDFFGGLSTADYTSSAGTLRLRAASIETEWTDTNVHAGLERLLISQSNPTSYATLGEPAMAWSGNLWAWVPQLTAEKDFNLSDEEQIQLAAALADIPDPGPDSNQYLRVATAAERSRYPGTEARAGYSWGESHASGIGVDAYLSPHNYGESGNVNAWAGLVDWHVMLPARFALSGEAYKGQALGGLGGGAFKDIVSEYGYGSADSYPARAAGVHDEGGWAQLKFHPNSLFELNGAFGQDNDLAAQLRAAGISASNPYRGLARNRTVLGNVIFRPRASFLLSLEYRKLESWQLVSPENGARIFGLAAGYEF
jgi:hypothetical protein